MISVPSRTTERGLLRFGRKAAIRFTWKRLFARYCQVMSEEIIERLRSGLEEFNRTGALDSGFLAADVEFRQADSIVDTAGTFVGEDGLRAALQELQEAFEDLSFEPEDIFAAGAGDVVVFIRVHGRGRGSGLRLDNQIAWLATVRADKIVRIAVYEERADALAAAGLLE